MKKLALSVLNPTSYLICMGIKTVENRTWKTDYRGRIYIHSSGGKSYPSLADYPYPVKLSDFLDSFQNDFELLGKMAGIGDDDDFDEIAKKLQSIGKYDKYSEILNFSKGISEYQENLKKYYGYDLYAEEPSEEYEKKAVNAVKQKGCYHKAFAVIGHVDLTDIVQDSDSVWAEKGQYHWILKNPVLYKEPVLNVKGKLRLFDVSHIDMPDDRK